MTDSKTSHPVRDVIDRLEELADDDTVCMADVFEAYGRSSFVPALIVPAIIVVSPLSGVPLVSSICGISIALIAIQMVLRRDHIWLPRFVRERAVSGERMRKGLHRMHRLADWLDAHTRERLALFRRKPLSIIPPLGCCAAGAAMPFMEIVPFTSSILGFAVLCYALSILARDGLFVVAGMTATAIAGAIPLTVISQVTG